MTGVSGDEPEWPCAAAGKMMPMIRPWESNAIIRHLAAEYGQGPF